MAVDCTGRVKLEINRRVRISHPRSAWYGYTGVITRIGPRLVFVKLDGTTIIPWMAHRSVRAI